jgi:hypothetical protein
MACGRDKTFTVLRVAEEVAHRCDAGAVAQGAKVGVARTAGPGCGHATRTKPRPAEAMRVPSGVAGTRCTPFEPSRLLSRQPAAAIGPGVEPGLAGLPDRDANPGPIRRC